MESVSRAREVEKLLRDTGQVVLADSVAKMIAEAEAAESDQVRITVGIRGTLRKFDGEYEPGKEPVETIEMEG